MTIDTKKARFNTISIQTVVCIGVDAQTELIRRALQSLNFVQFRTARSLSDIDSSAQFVIVVTDYTNTPAVQALARFMQSMGDFAGTKILYAVNPAELTNEELLFGVELDVKRTFFGPKKDEDLRNYIKQRALEATEAGSLTFVESEVRKAVQKHDSTAISHWVEKLSLMDKTSEDVNRLLAILSDERRDYKRYVFHLKQTLAANPQNLWAANRLGTYYLKNRQVAEGIDILKRMSRFHELNAERMLVLGDAYLNVGRAGEADRFLQRGHMLTGGADTRFAESLAKVDMLKGQPSKALERLGKKYLNTDIISFLNTRAVMAVRNNNFDEGVKLYTQALAGCDPKESLVLAKVLFNQGLALVRHGDPALAEAAFLRSLELGGSVFNRAVKPLAITRQLISKQKKAVGGGNSSMASAAVAMDEFEFESVF